MLNITEVKINKVENDDKLRGFASIVIDESFLVGDLRILEGEEGYFVAMPSKRKRDGSYKDIAFPITNEAREHVEKTVLLAYEKATGNVAISKMESEGLPTVRPDLLGVEEFGYTPKPSIP